MKQLKNSLNSVSQLLKSYMSSWPKLNLVLMASISIFAYAPFSIWPLMFVSFIALNYTLTLAASNKQKLWYFTIFAYIFNVVNLHWVGNSFLYNSPEPYLVYFMPLLVAGMAAILTLIYVFLFMIFNKAKDGLIKNILLVPTVFLTAEFIRSLSVFGFPWNLVGYSIAGNDALLQASELGTILVCSFLILFISSLIATFNKKAILVAVIVFVSWFTLGLVRFNTLDKSNVEKLSAESKLIQIDTTTHHKFDRIKMRKQVFSYLEQVKKVKYNKKVDIVVLPEMAVPYPINTEDSLLKLLQRSLGKNQTLIVGAPAYNDYDIYNTMYFVSKTDYKRYDKILLVPFGEFMPFRDFLPFIKNFTNNFKDFSVGSIANTVEFNGKKYLGLICYEAIFPFFVKENIEDKNTILTNITNDAWFYGTVAPYQHALIAKTRAVENNLAMIRVSNAGESFIR